jgi:hypothetical protein
MQIDLYGQIVSDIALPSFCDKLLVKEKSRYRMIVIML